jgi:hypothetical protein
VLARPWALTLPFNSQDIGTSRWQLAIERYTDFPRIRKGDVMAGIGPWQAPPSPGKTAATSLPLASSRGICCRRQRDRVDHVAGQAGMEILDMTDELAPHRFDGFRAGPCDMRRDDYVGPNHDLQERVFWFRRLAGEAIKSDPGDQAEVERFEEIGLVDETSAIDDERALRHSAELPFPSIGRSFGLSCSHSKYRFNLRPISRFCGGGAPQGASYSPHDGWTSCLADTAPEIRRPTHTDRGAHRVRG